MPEASVVLPCDASSVPTARHFVVQTLTSWGCGDASWGAAQIVSELAANCSLHARTEFSVRLQSEGGQLRLEVYDASPATVQLRRYSAQSTTGRGLRLVESLAHSWGVEPAAIGKTVWVSLRSADEDAVEDAADGTLDLDSLLAGFDDLDEGQEAPAQALRDDPLRMAA